jgi:nucleoside 2-deoxyribosyltransferase
MKIYVGGSLRDVTVDEELCQQFIEKLGAKIAEHGHILLTGCRGSLDKAIAESANQWLEQNGQDLKEIRKRIISYKLKADEPIHNFGRVQVSKRADWSLTTPDLSLPEQIAEADVAIFVAGSEGTFFAANWARISGKPILGVARFGGAGSVLFEGEREEFSKKYSHLVSKEDFDMLNQYTDDVDQLAEDVISLCENLMTSNSVFLVMSFKKEYIDLYDAYDAVCKNFGFKAVRTDQVTSLERITPRILDGIRHSAFVIADVTEKSLNVFYEIGFAEGLGRPVIVTAKEGTELPFDIKDTPIVFYSTLNELKQKLQPVIAEVKTKLGRG